MKIQIKRDKYDMLYECQHIKGVNIGSGHCTGKCEYNKYNNDIYIICNFLEELRKKKLDTL